MATPFPFKQITLQQFVQPYAEKYVGLGSLQGMQNFLSPVATTVDLADPTSTINTLDKFIGKPAYDETTGLPVWASGPLPADTWDGAGGGGGASPGAPINSIQFNNPLGVFAGDANLTWDGSAVGVTGDIVMGGDGSDIYKSTNNSHLTISGGDSADTGINIVLGGGASTFPPVAAFDFKVRKGTDDLMFFDASTGSFRFHSGTGVPVSALDLASDQKVTVFGVLNVGNNGTVARIEVAAAPGAFSPEILFQQNAVSVGILRYQDNGGSPDDFALISASFADILLDPGSQLVNIDGQVNARAGTTAFSSLNIPTGVAKTTPAHGDVHVTATDMIARINGVDFSMISAGAIAISGTPVNNRLAVWTNANTLEGEIDLQHDGTTFTVAAFMTISNTVGELTLKDSNQTAPNASPKLRFKDSANSTIGSIGYQTGATLLEMNNNQVGGDLRITSSSGPATTTVGGFIEILAGDGGSVSGAAGDITLAAGIAAGTGSQGAIIIPDSSAPDTTTNKLYVVSGNLFWNGVQLN